MSITYRFEKALFVYNVFLAPQPVCFYFVSGTLNATVPNLPEPFRGGPSASPFSQQHALAGSLPTQHQSKYSSSSSPQHSTTLAAATSSALITANGAPSSPQVVPVSSVGNHQQGNKNSFGLGTVAACPVPPGLEEQVHTSFSRCKVNSFINILL